MTPVVNGFDTFMAETYDIADDWPKAMSNNDVQPHPVFATRLVALAERLERAGQLAFAAELYELAASLTPRGEQLRQHARALRSAPAVDDDPEREFKRRNLEASHAVGMARIFEGRDDLGHAQEMFDLAKLRAPFHYLAYAGAGYLHLRRRDLAAALEEFVQARRLNPLDRKLAIEAARVALELEDYPEALRHAIDAVLLSQGMSTADEAAARRRVDTLAGLCRSARDELAELQHQRAAALQRASEQVALTQGAAVRGACPERVQTAARAADAGRDDLLRVALELRRFKAFRHFSDAQLVAARPARPPRAVPPRPGDLARGVRRPRRVRGPRGQAPGVPAHADRHAGAGDPRRRRHLRARSRFVDRRPRSTTLIGVEAGIAAALHGHRARPCARPATTSSASRLLWTFWHSLAAKVRAANAAMTEIIAPGGHDPALGARPAGRARPPRPERQARPAARAGAVGRRAAPARHLLAGGALPPPSR